MTSRPQSFTDSLVFISQQPRKSAILLKFSTASPPTSLRRLSSTLTTAPAPPHPPVRQASVLLLDFVPSRPGGAPWNDHNCCNPGTSHGRGSWKSTQDLSSASCLCSSFPSSAPLCPWFHISEFNFPWITQYAVLTAEKSTNNWTCAAQICGVQVKLSSYQCRSYLYHNAWHTAADESEKKDQPLAISTGWLGPLEQLYLFLGA